MINPPEPRLRAVVRSKENAPRAGRVACLLDPATAPDGDFICGFVATLSLAPRRSTAMTRSIILGEATGVDRILRGGRPGELSGMPGPRANGRSQERPGAHVAAEPKLQIRGSHIP